MIMWGLAGAAAGATTSGLTFGASLAVTAAGAVIIIGGSAISINGSIEAGTALAELVIMISRAGGGSSGKGDLMLKERLPKANQEHLKQENQGLLMNKWMMREM